MRFSAEPMNEPHDQTGKRDYQRHLERRAVSKGVIQPVTEPVKTSGVTKWDVRYASPGLNAGSVPPGSA
jgi:hypothetical protein